MDIHKALTGKKHIIVDLDRTLAHLHIDWSSIRSNLMTLIGKTDPELAQSWKDSLERTVYLYNDAIRRNGKSMKTTLDHFCDTYEDTHFLGFTPNSDLIGVIQSISDVSYSLWTSNTKKTARRVLHDLGLSSTFSHVVASEDVMLCKPEPHGFTIIHEKFGFQKTEYLFLGDSSYDEYAAKAAGIDFYKIDYFTTVRR